MTDEFPTRYDPKEAEPRIYSRWEKSGYFNPDRCVEDGLISPEADPFSVVLPPPNVTGTLHIGHAFEDTIQDIVVRYNRMQGKKTLWVPGTDHAAIATQAKVESILNKEEKKTRHDLGREEFLRRVHEFAAESHDTIVKQVKRMGASLDWSREAYTLDDQRNFAVRTAFEKMYDLGLIYRGARIVNWDPKMQTTVSDDEIEWIEETAPFYYFQYGPFVIGTSRPETKFGDKYVVMHPEDERYKQYANGQKIDLEWINGPITATVIKDSAVDPEFGTGVMTITPWHDAVDFDMSERHGLDKEQIIDLYGKLMPIAGEFAGLHISKARPLIAEKLREKGLLVKTDEKYIHRVATNSRGNGKIEPQIIKQWFVDVDKPFTLADSKIEGINSGEETTLKTIMKQAVSGGQVKIIPERFEKIYFHWIENLRDWCISRQLWFGHRIPVWYCLKCQNIEINQEPVSRWFLVRHGQTDSNVEGRMLGHSNVPLNETGRAQATLTADQLKNQKIDIIISSDLDRCRETAEAIQKATGAELLFDPGLRERSHGDAEGMLREEAEEKYGELYLYDKKVANGESYEELEKRIWEVFIKHHVNLKHKNVVIVSHGGSIRMLQKKIKNLSVEEAMVRDSVKNAQIISIDILKDPCSSCGEHLYEQDSDTLDTWFSSGMWTFSTLGWPEKTNDFKTYHPNSFMAPGYEIIFMWVARMILMSGCLLGEVPFKTAYFHGIVRDKKGQKFSKSKGNGIDPLDMAEKYGADALRMALIAGASPGNDVKFDEDRVRGYRNFATKIWNASRFLVMNKPDSPRPEHIKKTEADEKILSEFLATKLEVAKHIEEFDFHLASEKAYHYFWHTFADKIIEESKTRLKGDDVNDRWQAYETLEQVLLGSLIMLHPFMPFVTEEIYQKFRPEKLLLVERWD